LLWPLLALVVRSGDPALPSVSTLLAVARAREAVRDWRGRMEVEGAAGVEGGLRVYEDGSWRFALRDPMGRVQGEVAVDEAGVAARWAGREAPWRAAWEAQAAGWGPELLPRALAGGLPAADWVGAPTRVGDELWLVARAPDGAWVRVGLDARDGWPVHLRLADASGAERGRLQVERRGRSAVPVGLRALPPALPEELSPTLGRR
jgi:hypothetical protein